MRVSVNSPPEPRKPVVRRTSDCVCLTMSGDERNVEIPDELPSQKALDELEERVVQRILNRMARDDAGEGTSKGPKGGGESLLQSGVLIGGT